MSSEYPDVLGDLVDARQRFEANGVHYVATLEPDTIYPGETTALRLWLQSCWDVPVDFVISIELPAQQPAPFSVLQTRTDVPLKPAEVGQVSIPIACAAATEPGEYKISITVGAKFETRGMYCRSQKAIGHFDDELFSFAVGTGLAQTMGLGFEARTQPEQALHLSVEGAPPVGEPSDLTPTYVSHWTVDDLPIQGKARQHVNDQRLYILPQLNRQSLYMAFLQESQERFKDADLPLQIGEAIFLAKILTFTVERFLKNPDQQDGILVPAYTLAHRYKLPTNDPVFLVARADYARVARLAISLSFGLLRQRLKRDVWTLEDQLAVAGLVADRVERGGALPAEFLYLPLLLGGLIVAHQVQMPGENPAQSLGLFAKARQQRDAEFVENPELVAILARLLKLAQSGS